MVSISDMGSLPPFSGGSRAGANPGGRVKAAARTQEIAQKAASASRQPVGRMHASISRLDVENVLRGADAYARHTGTDAGTARKAAKKTLRAMIDDQYGMEQSSSRSQVSSAARGLAMRLATGDRSNRGTKNTVTRKGVAVDIFGAVLGHERGRFNAYGESYARIGSGPVPRSTVIGSPTQATKKVANIISKLR